MPGCTPTTSGPAPDESVDGVLGDLDQGVSELLLSLWRDWAASATPRRPVVAQSDLGQNETDSQWHQCLHHPRTATHSVHMRPGVVLQQEEPSRRSEDFLPVPNSSQRTVGYDMEVCVTLQGYASPDHHWPTAKLVLLDNVHHSVSRLFHAHHMCSVSHVLSVTCS